MGADLRPTSGEQKIVLTPATIHALLSQNTALRRAHAENVPHKMAERDFWTHYVQSRFFTDQTGASAGSADNPLNAYYEEPQDEALELKGKTRVSRLVDLAATSEDHFSDYGNKTQRQQQSAAGAETESVSLIRKFNQHALRIVQTTASAPLPLRIEDAVVIDDLNALPGAATLSLTLSTTQANQGASSAEVQSKGVSPQGHGEIKAFASQLKTIRLDAKRVIGEAHGADELRDHVPPPAPMANTADGVSFEQVVLLPAFGDALVFQRNAVEILRHFWGCYPAGKDTEKQAKCHRMLTILEQLGISARAMVTSRSDLQDQIYIEHVMGPIVEAIDCALAKRVQIVQHSQK